MAIRRTEGSGSRPIGDSSRPLAKMGNHSVSRASKKQGQTKLPLFSPQDTKVGKRKYEGIEKPTTEEARNTETVAFGFFRTVPNHPFKTY